MAEALARHFCGETLDPASGGISPLGFITPETFQVLTEVGVSTAGLNSKGLAALSLPECQLIVNLTDYSLEGLLPAIRPGSLLQRYVRDPYGLSLEAYRQARDEITRLITEEIVPRVRGYGAE
jgi:protein-tyrosine-phosphatase